MLASPLTTKFNIPAKKERPITSGMVGKTKMLANTAASDKLPK
jgi:hypothetical protein